MKTPHFAFPSIEQLRNVVHEVKFNTQLVGDPEAGFLNESIPLPFIEFTGTVKLHGCLKNDTLISLWNGSKKTIQEIVDNRLDEILLGFDQNNKPVPVKIKNWFNNGRTDEWLKIGFSYFDYNDSITKRKIVCTPNHKFYIARMHEYREAKDLAIGDAISFSKHEKKLSSMQKSILLGKLLGDGSLHSSKKMMTFGHKLLHLEYLNFSLQSLGDIAGKLQKNIVSGFGTEMARANTLFLNCIRQNFKHFYNENGQKIVPDSIELDPISVAFWYMDDGSLSHSDFQKDRACFATCGFDRKSVENLAAALKKLLNSEDIVVYQTDEYWRIRLNTNAAYLMFEMIKPYIPTIMQYKLPEKMRGMSVGALEPEECFGYEIEEREIFSIEKCDIKKENSQNSQKYDLETETHNFVANNIIVHNSNAGIVWDKENKRIYTQSRERVITIDNDNGGFARFVSTLPHDDLLFSLKKGEYSYIKIYGEWCGQGIQKGVAINALPRMFVVFAGQVDDRWLTRAEIASIKLPEHRVFNIFDAPTWKIKIDFNNPEESLSTLEALTLEVEKACPFAKLFGAEGIGEGIVWTAEHKGHRYAFKTKGELHKNIKETKLVSLEPEKAASLMELVNSVCTEQRMEQGLEKMKEKHGSIDRKYTGELIGWVLADIEKENLDMVQASGFDMKMINKDASAIIRQWFFKRV
jgi:intein/homing endonuclease